MLVCYLEVFVFLTVLMFVDALMVGGCKIHILFFIVYIRLFFLLFSAVGNVMKCTNQCKLHHQTVLLMDLFYFFATYYYSVHWRRSIFIVAPSSCCVINVRARYPMQTAI